MPDYSSCTNTECPVRGNCARYRMVWGRRQSAGLFTAKNCDAQMPIDMKNLPFTIQSLALADAAVRDSKGNKP